MLRQFAQAGVEVRVDPRIDTSVLASFRGVVLDDALESLLEPYDYFLTWTMLPGPLGRIPKLKQIQVFMPGSPAAARPINRGPFRFDTSRGVAGTSPEFVKNELLVGVRPGTTYARFQHLLDQIGGMIVNVDAASGIYLIRFPYGSNVEALLAQLTRNPIVAHAELNYVSRLPPGTAATLAAEAGARLPAVTPPADGSVPVAVLDSGLDPSAGLSSVVSAAWNAVDPSQSLTDPVGHGTQMTLLASGLAAADGTAADSILPVVAVGAFDADGKTSNFAILQALAYAAQAGAKVVNMSWGSETDSDFMRTAMQLAADNGLILVAAAGNSPTGEPVYPAAYSSVLAVGGVTADGQAWTGSNYGDFVSLSAPATATLPVGSNGSAGTYVGTSISSAVAANALADYVNRHPDATADEVWNALRSVLSPAPAAGYGAGILDDAALQRFLSL